MAQDIDSKIEQEKAELSALMTRSIIEAKHILEKQLGRKATAKEVYNYLKFKS